MHRALKKWLPPSIENLSAGWVFLALAGSVSLVLLSIAASQILLAAALIGCAWQIKRPDFRALMRHPILLPLLAFLLWTIVVAWMSPNALQSLGVLRKLLVYLILFLIPAVVREETELTWIYKSVFAVSFIACMGGLFQFFADPERDLLHRISGFMSHWMTYSGLLMLVFVMLLAYALCFGWRKHKWVIPLACIIILVLVLSETRNAWMGAVAGAFIVILLRRRRATLILVVVLLAVYFAMPGKIQQRLQSGLDPNDPNTRNRIELFETSIRLIKQNPWFGVGPANVNREALHYRGSKEYPDWMYQHMHNNVLQIAVERGIPGLALWLWLMIRLAWDALRLYRSRARDSASPASREVLMISAAALGAWAAFLFAGMLEYNFGDSEVLTLFLFIMGAPYARRQFPIHDSRFPIPDSRFPTKYCLP